MAQLKKRIDIIKEKVNSSGDYNILYPTTVCDAVLDLSTKYLPLTGGAITGSIVPASSSVNLGSSSASFNAIYGYSIYCKGIFADTYINTPYVKVSTAKGLQYYDGTSTWTYTLPAKTGTMALTSDIPTIDTSLSSTSTNPVQNKAINSALAGKQAKLVSGTNIKTINGNSLLGSGNVSISSGQAMKYDFMVVSADETNMILDIDNGQYITDIVIDTTELPGQQEPVYVRFGGQPASASRYDIKLVSDLNYERKFSIRLYNQEGMYVAFESGDCWNRFVSDVNMISLFFSGPDDSSYNCYVRAYYMD